ncbi:DUF5682 family protein [Winogradskya consettensis]|uniref:VWFA domain-containing protein n=1 Tax=Winogradskya consettensis TaxID=113560 RepID=A0A919VS64_9ACTN|nr:DUF5682 family protein [Actinoplanes consettensis]GIM73887.1 hypothetical protein Aco04nite_37660 [Actinoplanes consettensis]
MTDPRAVVEELAGDDRVQLIGVRHHSPVLAVAVPALLDAFAPETVLVELPAEMQPWVRWLADPGTTAPVALAADAHVFYPFADFSPELAALRWAQRNGVPVICCDLPLTDPDWESGREDPSGPSLGAVVRTALTGRDDDDLWDRLIEAGAPGSTPEGVRRAALAAGWALRHNTAVGPLDLRREAWMRGHITRTPGRVAVVVGAFHAPALLSGPLPEEASSPGPAPVISLVPYTFGLLDARSGYPAGIRDPRWQQAVHDCGADPARIRSAVGAFAVEVTRELRAQGHPAGPAEAAEVTRLAADLAGMRTLPAPGRGELVEALQTVLAQGSPAGVGRGVAQAMETVLIGRQRGRLPAGAPVTGLRPAVERELARLKLPGPGRPAERIRLDPLRSPTDRVRDLTIRRLTACGIPYATPGTAGPAVGGESLTSTWRVEWTPGIDAALALVGLHGVTLAHAAEGMLTTRRHRETRAGGPTPEQSLTGLEAAASCAATTLTHARLTDLRRSVCHTGTVTQLVTALHLLTRLGKGHFPSLAPAALGTAVAEARADLHAAAVAAVAGTAGSTRVEDARALYDLVRAADEAGLLLRLSHTIRALTRDGSPLIRGAAAAVGVLTGYEEPSAFGHRLASWVTLPGTAATDRLRGALSVAGALLQSGDEILTPLLTTIDNLPDDDFVRRLPALRGGFDALTPADRDRLLTTVTARHGPLDEHLPTDAATLATWLSADRAGLAALTALALPPTSESPHPAPAELSFSAPSSSALPSTITAEQRWRLLLGRESDQLPARQRRLATALDELYGAGHGEGAWTAGGGGGQEAAYPQVRDWLDELQALFGADVRDEVLARAAEHGRLDAVLAADPERVRPSIDLLHAVLSLAGGLPEARLARLRPLVARLTAELTAQLARRIRPALTGLGTSRPTLRPTGRLDLAATVRRNLHTVRADAAGRPQLVPERPVFRTPGRRSVDWQVILLVDVSGSMEQSTIWAALTASIVAGVPALRTHFVTFSTEVIDLTDRVTDPLSLLLEIRVGGGTHIAAALRYARQIALVPSRTLVITISDFEEGFPLGGLLTATRALTDDGITLLGCASLDDRGAPRYSTGTAAQLAAAGMPVAALSPTELARWIGDQIR